MKTKYLLFYFGFLLIVCFSRCRCNYYNIPADVNQGGRSVAVAINPTNQNIIWVASESGGVFKTTDGGHIWAHADSLPQFGCFDLAVAPSNPNIVIVSTFADSRVLNGGGVWVSNDGGNLWQHPSTALPLYGGVPARFSAYGINFVPGTRKVYAGTDSGVILSNDLGATWRYINPAPDGAKQAIYAVLTLSTGKVLLYGDAGIWISDNGLTGWHHDATGLGHGWDIHGAFAVSPLNNNHLFFTNGWDSYFYSTDGGDNWRPISLGFAAYDASRQPFVKAVRSSSGIQNEIDIYCSNKSYVGKKTLRWTGSDYDFSGSWSIMPFSHWDPADLAFANDGIHPLIAVNDGGVEKTTDAGASWQVISRPSNFFNALQVFNVKGSFYTGTPPRVDLYFGTQDNYFWASGNDGANWPYSTGNEGFQIQGPQSFNNTSDSDISYFNIGGCPQCLSNPHYVRPTDISKPTPYESTIPTFVKGKTYVCFARPTETSSANYIYVSNDEGSSWAAPGLRVNRDLAGFPVISGPSSNPSVIVAYYASGSSGASGVYGLVKIDNLFDGITGNESRHFISMPAGSNLGTVPTMWPWYPCFGVDPANPDFIIIPDVGNNKVWLTTNGGRGWNERPDLFDLVTDHSNLYFNYQFAMPQIRSIAFDPANPNHIAIGTSQAGVIYSRDHGVSWQKLPRSELIPFITSFFFRDDTTAIASTYGRGLSKLYLRQSPIQQSQRLGLTNINSDTQQNMEHTKLNDFNNGLNKSQDNKSDGNSDENIDTTKPVLKIQSMIPGSAIVNIEAGKKIPVRGWNWTPHLPLTIIIDGSAMEQKNIQVDGNGQFKLELEPFYEPKLHIVAVQQIDDKNHTKNYASITIKASMADDDKKK